MQESHTGLFSDLPVVMKFWEKKKNCQSYLRSIFALKRAPGVKVCERGMVERGRRNNLDTFDSSELLKRYRCLCHNQAANTRNKSDHGTEMFGGCKNFRSEDLSLLQPPVSGDHTAIHHSSHSITVISSTLTLHCKTYTIPLFTRPRTASGSEAYFCSAIFPHASLLSCVDTPGPNFS